MNDERSFERTARAWLELGANQAPDRAIQAVLRDIETTPQERDLRIPWRLPRMNKFVAIGLGTAAVIVALFVGSQFFGQPAPGVVGGGPSVEPTATPSPTPTTSPRPSSATSPPPLTQSFTSTQHGISLAYPEGWTARAASEPWTESTFPLDFGSTHVDVLHDPTLMANLFLTFASQPIGDATPEDWLAEQMASDEGCGTVTMPFVVDGADGLIGTGDCDVVVVTSAGRGYWIQLYTSGDDPAAVAPYTRAWFEEVLATTQLKPADAVDTSAAPSS